MDIRAAACSLFMVAALCSHAAAQVREDQPRFVFGPMGGVAFSNLRGSSANGGRAGDSEGRTGGLVGAFATYGFTPYYAVEPQVFYVQKGGSVFIGYSGNGTLSEMARVRYLEIPLLFKARYPIGDGRWPLILSALAGPAIGIKLSCVYEADNGTTSECGDDPATEFYLEPTPNDIDFSGVFGIGVDYYHFAFQARYDLSITNSFASTSQLYPYLKNQAWELTLGYKLAVK